MSVAANHYVDNKKLLSEIKIYKEECKTCEEQNQITPPIPDYIGECFMKIAERLSYRPNFVNYAFRDEMIADGIENCVQYAHNFNPEKSNNPFAYFTQIIYYAFVRRIQKEKKQLYVKYKTIQDNSLLSSHISTSEHETSTYDTETITEEQKINMYDFVKNFENSKANKKVVKKPSNTLETFFDNPEE